MCMHVVPYTSVVSALEIVTDNLSKLLSAAVVNRINKQPFCFHITLSCGLSTAYRW